MCRAILVWLSILQLVLTVVSNGSPPIIRQTSNGPVEGVEKISSLGQKYYSFRGIPFAEAPITGTDPHTGELVDRRFKAPVPLKRRWTDALKVHDFGKICSQPGLEENSNTSEDCLFLNVNVPADGSKEKTVLVWIHGGGFQNGEGTDVLHGPDFLLSQDNVVVTIQYRLGIFGFLNLNFGEYTGSMGLKDQQLAMKWIHENIQHFSGNKSEILLFGQSSGGVSVHLHMLNKESRLYFQRAYVVSSSAIQTYVLTKVDHVHRLQECLKINETDKLMEHLKAENSSTLLNCSPYEDPNEPFFKFWVPVIESSNTNDAFLTKTPEEIYNDPDEEKPIMDAMFSFTGQEILVSYSNESESSQPLINENVMETTKFKLPFKGFSKLTHPKEYEEALKKFRNAYFWNTTNADAVHRTNDNLLSDSGFNYAIVKAFALQSEANQKIANDIERKKTFLFRFNVTADLNLKRIITNTKPSDAQHSDDICYIFHCHALDEIKIYDEHLESKGLLYDLIMRSVKIITNFARTGDPSIEGDTPFKSSNSSDELFCQEVANELKTSVTTDIRQQIHYDVWHEVDEIYKDLKAN